VASLLLAVSCEKRPTHGTVVDPPIDIPAIELTTSNGAPVHIGGPTSGPTVVFFGYTHCPDICPTTLSDWRRISTALGQDASRVRFIFVSVDRERDTPEIAARYAAQFHPGFIGVTGDSATLARAHAAFMVTSAVQAMPMAGHEPTAAHDTTAGHAMPGSRYLVTHSGQQFLLDKRGRIVSIYSSGNGRDALAADLGRLL
jgi:protein SCO1/2